MPNSSRARVVQVALFQPRVHKVQGSQQGGLHRAVARLQCLLHGSSAGLGFIEGDGSGSARLVFSGSAAAINAALATLEYRPDADYHGADTLTLSLDDGALSHAGSVALTVTPVTDGSGEALQALGSRWNILFFVGAF